MHLCTVCPGTHTCIPMHSSVPVCMYVNECAHICVYTRMPVGGSGTIGHMAVGSGVDGIAQCLFKPLVAGKVEGVSWPRPHSSNVQTANGPPEALSPHNAPQRLHHVPIARRRLRLQALHPRLKEGQKESGGRERSGQVKPSTMAQSGHRACFDILNHLLI